MPAFSACIQTIALGASDLFLEGLISQKLGIIEIILTYWFLLNKI